MKNPTARQDDIVVQDVLDEMVIYDLKRDKVHLLNPTVTFVWQQCNGQHSPDELASLLQQELQPPQPETLVWLTLEQLEKAHLLTGKVINNGHKTITRRQMLKMAGVGIALLPVVKTIVAPTVAQAVSPVQSSPYSSVVECQHDDDCGTNGLCINGQCW